MYVQGLVSSILRRLWRIVNILNQLLGSSSVIQQKLKLFIADKTILAILLSLRCSNIKVSQEAL